MSALGRKRTLGQVRLMSALPPKADMDRCDRDVCFVPKADSCTAAINASLRQSAYRIMAVSRNVRFFPKAEISDSF
jgi:hypothetical protein